MDTERTSKNIFTYTQQRCFSVNFAKFFRTSFSEHLFYRAPLRNCLNHVQFAEFQPPDTVKNYFASAFQAFYTRTTSSHSKTLKS